MTVSGIQQFDHIIVFMCLSFGLRQCSTVGDVNFVCASRSGLFLFRPVRVILVQAGRGYCSGRLGFFLFRPVGVIVQAGRGYSCSGRSGLLFRPVGVILVQAGQGYSFLLTQNYTQYIPLSLYDLQAWMGSPSIYIFDCSNAGTVFSGFSVDSCVNREEGYPLPRAHKNGQLE